MRFPAELERNAANRSRVQRDVFTDATVAARHSARQQLLLVMQRQRKPVNLQLRHVFEPPSLGEFLAALVERAQLVEVVTVVERKHRPAVHHLRKTLSRFAAHALRWAVRRYLIGMLLFESLQSLEQRVIFRVRDLGIVVDVIKNFMTANLFAQLFDFLTD